MWNFLSRIVLAKRERFCGLSRSVGACVEHVSTRDTLRTQKIRALTLAFFLSVFARGVTRITRCFLLGKKQRHAIQLFALLPFGGMLGFFLGLTTRLFLGLTQLFGLKRGQPLFLGALGLTFVAGSRNCCAFLGTLVRGAFGGFGAGLGFGQHLGARLGRRFHAFVEFLVFVGGHVSVVVKRGAVGLPR